MSNLSDEQVAKQIEKILDQVWEAFDKRGLDTYEEMASEAGVHWSTVYRLYQGETRFPQTRTLARLASAAGFNLLISPVDQKAGRTGLRKAG